MAETQPSFSVKSFYDFLIKRKLMGVKCTKCNAVSAPPRPICPKCGSTKMSWVELSGKAKLTTFTVVHVGPSELASETPYVVGVAELSEGPKVSCRITGVDPTNPESIKIGSPMIVDFIIKGEKAVLGFRPAT
ncbi:MAG: Zn-ribbon domain-containing OB-fold protein [Promethearchaeati archaeon SRVP18_Atabeyarchaeia-1]